MNEDLDSAVDEAVKDTRFGPDRYNAILRYFNGWGSSHDGKRGPSPRVTRRLTCCPRGVTLRTRCERDKLGHPPGCSRRLLRFLRHNG